MITLTGNFGVVTDFFSKNLDNKKFLVFLIYDLFIYVHVDRILKLAINEELQNLKVLLIVNAPKISLTMKNS